VSLIAAFFLILASNYQKIIIVHNLLIGKGKIVVLM